MKKILSAIIFAGLFVSRIASATPYLEEAFPYALGGLSGLNGWSSSSAVQVTAGSLSYSGLQVPTVASNRVNLISSAGTLLKSFNATPVTSGSVYLSFILRQTALAASTTGGTVAGLDDDGSVTTANGRVAAGLGVHLKQTNTTRYLVGIRKGPGTGAGGGTDAFYTGSTFAVGDVVFVVAKYTFGAGVGDDTVTLWVNPSADFFGGAEPAPSITATTTGNATDAAQLQYVFVRANSSTASGVNELDDLRVGSTWADVTPTDGVVPPAPTSQPRITESFLSPGGLVLRGTNGPANGVYQVLSSPLLTTPMNNWPPIATNLFDVSGNFDSTNPVPPNAAQRFYRLLVGGQIIPTGDAPTIITQPTNQIVLAGANVTFNAAANGAAPLAYQWFFNTNTPIASATNPTLALLNVQAGDVGGYSLRVTNAVGAVTSVVAFLTVNFPPLITAPLPDQNVAVSNSVTFTVFAEGSAPLRYQWYFNTNTPIANATNATYTIATVLTNQAGKYAVIVTNNFGAATSSVATLTVQSISTNLPDFNLYGFGAPTTGGGMIPETDPGYRKVYTPGDLRLALLNSSGTKVIEIMNDLNLGWNEIGATNRTGAFRANASASLHPVLIASGVTLIDIQDKNGLTIFSANGATIRHAEFNLKRSHNILIRNLKFDELWEWDEISKGDYDSKDWDFITVGDGGTCTNVWIDHCDFTKSYDGTVDIKGGANNVTISWCRVLGDDGGPNSFVRRQIVHLETNGVAEAMFDFLRNNGFSVEDIIAITRSQKKGHLAGANELDSDNADIKLTLHHNYYFNFQDRIPRLRAGNAHVYNVYVNNTEALAAKSLRNTRVAAMTPSEALKLSNGTYKFDVTLNGAISTEDGAVLVEKCHIVDVTSPLRNNQVDANNATYTGKIRAEDTIYTLNGSTFRGNTEDVGSPLVPVPAPLKPFSWNGFVNLPYSYPLNDPSTIAATITNNAGQGVIFWAKTNWFKTTY
jgi:pectate lyase